MRWTEDNCRAFWASWVFFFEENGYRASVSTALYFREASI